MESCKIHKSRSSGDPKMIPRRWNIKAYNNEELPFVALPMDRWPLGPQAIFGKSIADCINKIKLVDSNKKWWPHDL